MIKTSLKIILIATVTLVFVFAFSSSYNSHNIDHLDYVIAIGIDKAPSEDNLQISFEFTDLSAFSESKSSNLSNPIINSVVASSIPEAINLMNAYAGKQLSLSHCKVVVFSEDVAQNGISQEITYLMNDTQIRPTTNVIIANETAKDYIKNSSSSLEGILTKYYDIFPTSADYTGYTSNILLGQFYRNLTNTESGAVAILGTKSKNESQSNSSNKKNSISSDGSSQNNTSNDESSLNSTNNNSETNDTSSNTSTQSTHLEKSSDNSSLDNLSPGFAIVDGDRGTENIGLAVFKDDKYIDKLSAIDTLCYSLIENDVDTFTICINSPFEENKKIDISVSSLEPAFTNINLSKDVPVITIKLNLTGKTLTGQENLRISDSSTLTKINDSMKDYLSSKMKDYLYKTSRNYKCDLNGFNKLAKKKFLTIPDYTNYNWNEKYPSAEFNIEIQSNIISSLLIQDS